MRDKIIDGKLKVEDCNNEEVYEFLKLLASETPQQSNRIFQPITNEDWIQEIK